jgi:hypothetical protein
MPRENHAKNVEQSQRWRYQQRWAGYIKRCCYNVGHHKGHKTTYSGYREEVTHRRMITHPRSITCRSQSFLHKMKVNL